MSEALQTTPSCACSRGPTPGCRAPSRFLDRISAPRRQEKVNKLAWSSRWQSLTCRRHGGRKLLYTGGFLLFVLSSALCGLAPSLPVLIAFRVAPSIGAALRSCGISIGVAAASSLLAWRLAVRTGSGHNTLHAEAQQLLAAGRDVIVLLGSFAAMAGVISLARVSARRPCDAKDASA